MTQVIKFTLGLALTALVAFGAVGLAVPQMAHAQQGTSTTTGTGVLGANDFLPSDFVENTGLGGSDENSLENTIGNLIRTVIQFLGIVAVVIVLYGGFRWMTASGNDEKVAQAKKILIAGLIGLAIVLMSLAITNFAIRSILSASTV